MIFRKEHGVPNTATVVERKCRYTLLFRNNDRRSEPIMSQLIWRLAPLPVLARQSLTFDRGLEHDMGTTAWFCDPQAPWQKGTVENTNRRARKWLLRDVDPLSVTDADLIEICNHLNATPRKCLGYRTPGELFRTKLLAQMRHAGWLQPARRSRLNMNSQIHKRSPLLPLALALLNYLPEWLRSPSLPCLRHRWDVNRLETVHPQGVFWMVP